MVYLICGDELVGWIAAASRLTCHKRSYSLRRITVSAASTQRL